MLRASLSMIQSIMRTFNTHWVLLFVLSRVILLKTRSRENVGKTNKTKINTPD